MGLEPQEKRRQVLAGQEGDPHREINLILNSSLQNHEKYTSVASATQCVLSGDGG